MKTLSNRDMLDVLNLLTAQVGHGWHTCNESKATIESVCHYWYKTQPKLKITAKVTSCWEPKWGPSTSTTELVSVVLSLTRRKVLRRKPKSLESL